jgi:hypothetical protein
MAFQNAANGRRQNSGHAFREVHCSLPVESAARRKGLSHKREW